MRAGRSVWLDRLEGSGTETRLVEYSPQLPQGFTPVGNITFWPGVPAGCLHARMTCRLLACCSAFLECAAAVLSHSHARLLAAKVLDILLHTCSLCKACHTLGISSYLACAPSTPQMRCCTGVADHRMLYCPQMLHRPQAMLHAVQGRGCRRPATSILAARRMSSAPGRPTTTRCATCTS